MAKITITTDDGTVVEVIEQEDIGDLEKRLAGVALLETITEAVKRAKQTENRQSLYLDYVNNFLTVGNFAKYYGLSRADAMSIIEEGKAKQ